MGVLGDLVGELGQEPPAVSQQVLGVASVSRCHRCCNDGLVEDVAERLRRGTR